MFRDILANSITSRLIESIDLSSIKLYEPYPCLPRNFFVDPEDVPRGLLSRISNNRKGKEGDVDGNLLEDHDDTSDHQAQS